MFGEDWAFVIKNFVNKLRLLFLFLCLPTPFQPPLFRPKLSGTTFQKDLGSLLDKAVRVERLVGPLAEAVAAQPGQAGWGSGEVREVAAQAAALCKADLATSTVTEMTALAGTMGRHYAYKQVSLAHGSASWALEVL